MMKILYFLGILFIDKIGTSIIEDIGNNIDVLLGVFFF